MECRDFQKSIGPYLSEEIEDSTMNDFLNHADQCEKCREELELEYIVMKGPEIIDSPEGNYDIPACFRDHLQDGKDYIRFRKRILTLRYIMDTAVFWAVLFSLIRVITIIVKR